MLQTISALQQKGGVGKSTLICAIAHYLGRLGARVLIIDADRQGTCTAFHDCVEQPFNVIAALDVASLAAALDRYAADHDLVLIDTPGIDSALTAHVAAASDLVLIPSTPSAPDAQGAARTWSLVERVRAANAGRPHDVRVILTKYQPTARITASIAESFRSNGMPLYPYGLQELTGFKEMYSIGGANGAAAGALKQLITHMQLDRIIKWTPEND